MDLRLHPCRVAPAEDHEKCRPNRPTPAGSSCNNAVSRTRVLRVMRAQGLLSPHRGRQGEMQAHEGTIVTSAPDVMWGTDGVRVFTAADGWV